MSKNIDEGEHKAPKSPNSPPENKKIRLDTAKTPDIDTASNTSQPNANTALNEGDEHGSNLFDEELDEEEELSSIVQEEDVDEDVIITRVLNPAHFDENKQKEQEDRKLMALLANFSDEQLTKFETFKRATFPKATVKRLVMSISNTTICQNVVIAMSGMTKVFIGELLELAYEKKKSSANPNQKLTPKHIRDAYLEMQIENKCSNAPKLNIFR